MTYPGLTDRLAAVREHIAAAQQRAGTAGPVRILAVTKGHGPEAVRAAVQAGLTAVGENRVQEALAKQEAAGGLPVEWHLIGSLQRNKVRQAVGRFAMIHTVDRPELAVEISRRVPPGSAQSVLVEVNCGDEPQKAGVARPDAVRLVAAVRGLPGLEFRGLMTMAPFTDDEGVQRVAFRRLRLLKEELERQAVPVMELSMGMSGDFGIAVEEGATMVRLGNILFGERER